VAEALNGIHPLIYALLPNKQEKTYDKLFDMLNLLKPGLNPRSVSCDFELSVINTIKKNILTLKFTVVCIILQKTFIKK